MIKRNIDEKIKIGDIVKIINWKNQGDRYEKWVMKNAPDYAIYYTYGILNIIENCNYQILGNLKVVAIAPDIIFDDVTLYLIQDDYTKACFLFSENDLKLTD